MRILVVLAVLSLGGGCQVVQERLESAPSLQQGSIGVAPWLGEINALAVPPEGIRLATVVDSIEQPLHLTYLTAATTAIANHSDDLKKLDVEIRRLHLLQGTVTKEDGLVPDVVCIMRGPFMHVFPRELFLQPELADLPILPGDHVLSAPLTEIRAFADPDPPPASSASQSFAATGPLAPVETIMSTDSLPDFQSFELQRTLMPPPGETSLINLIIHQREYEGVLYRLYLPYRFSAEFGLPPIAKSIQPPNRDPIFRYYKNRKILDGDVFIVTRLSWALQELQAASGGEKPDAESATSVVLTADGRRIPCGAVDRQSTKAATCKPTAWLHGLRN
jgi:hypothetical protein